MPLAGTEKINGAVAIGDDHDRRVGETDRQAGVLLHDSPAQHDIVGRERFELIRSALDFAEECQLCRAAQPLSDEEVDLGRHERRQKAWGLRGDERPITSTSLNPTRG